MVKDITQQECIKFELHALTGSIPLLLAGVLLFVVPKVCFRRFDRAIRIRAGRTSKDEPPRSAEVPVDACNVTISIDPPRSAEVPVEACNVTVSNEPPRSA